jgi:site-specific DNA-methyltransferase (adenine-specific)
MRSQLILPTIKKYHQAMMTSLNQDWRTPQRIYDELNKEFHFDFDPCPNNPHFDGLEVEWGNSNFINPPYGRIIVGKYKGKSLQDLFVKRAFEESLKGKLSVLLIPVRTSSKRWQNYILNQEHVEIRFMSKRFKFSDYSEVAPFDSAVVIFRGQ